MSFSCFIVVLVVIYISCSCNGYMQPSSKSVRKQYTHLHSILSDSEIYKTLEKKLLDKSVEINSKIGSIDIKTQFGIDIDAKTKEISDFLQSKVTELNTNYAINEQVASVKSILLDAINKYIDVGSISVAVDRSVIWNYINIISANPLTVPTFLLASIIVSISSLDYQTISNPYDDTSISNGKNNEAAVFSFDKQERFYGKYPFYVASRLLNLFTLSSSFGFKLFLDWRFNRLEENEAIRAKEVLELIPKLGPTAIKLGQALSIRTDILSETYALELRKLQDAVPPFDSIEAKKIIKEQLKLNDLTDYFQSISEKPIASASIGQVYKAKLIDGKEVAVKVQRPNILNEISLDLYIMALVTPLQIIVQNAVNKRKTEQADIDVALELVEEWSKGFVREVNYIKEAENAENFIAAMIKRNLTSVTAPSVVYAAPKVLLTQWIDGTRLDIDKSEDTARLCSLAINAYLTMLLDTATLHADAHAGNLLRGTDKKLYILDWGMTVSVAPELQYSLLEFISHVNTEDFDALPQDFVNLGFSPSDKLEQVRNSGLTDGLSFALRMLSKGGGPKKISMRVKEEFKTRYGADLSDDELRIKAREEMVEKMQEQLKKEGVNVNGITATIEEMSRRNRELFRLPSWVLYTTRAFSILEGFGLKLDDDFSILQSCYPYLASRLFSDNSSRSKNALRNMLFSNNNIVSVDKYVDMTSNFNKYTSSIQSVDEIEGKKVAQDAMVKLLLSDSSPVQDILLESSASLVDSLIVEAYNTVSNSTASRFIKNTIGSQSSIINTIVPQPLRMPLLLPLQLIQSADILLQRTAEDRQRVGSFRDAVSSLSAAAAASRNSNNANTADSTAITTTTTNGDTATPSTRSTVLSSISMIQENVTPELLKQIVQSSPNISRKFLSLLSRSAAKRFNTSIATVHKDDSTTTTVGQIGYNIVNNFAEFLEPTPITNSTV